MREPCPDGSGSWTPEIENMFSTPVQIRTSLFLTRTTAASAVKRVSLDTRSVRDPRPGGLRQNGCLQSKREQERREKGAGSAGDTRERESERARERARERQGERQGPGGPEDESAREREGETEGESARGREGGREEGEREGEHERAESVHFRQKKQKKVQTALRSLRLSS